MKTFPMKRVNIIGDETVQFRLVKEIRHLGPSGYTYYFVHGAGVDGERPRYGEPPNAKIEVVCTPDLADQILQHLDEHYLSHYAIIAFIDDVAVVRGYKFDNQTQLPEDQRQAVQKAANVRNLQNCLAGLDVYQCNASQLGPQEKIALAQAAHDRILQNCLEGEEDCELSRLTPQEEQNVARVSYDRDLQRCALGYEDCDRSHLDTKN